MERVISVVRYIRIKWRQEKESIKKGILLLRSTKQSRLR